MFLINYFFGGIIIMFLFDLIGKYTDLPLMSLIERVVILFLWPLILMLFIFEIVRNI